MAISRHLLRSFGMGLTRLLNPLIMRLAGSPHVPMLAIIQHRGRRSGRLYSTPVGARPTTDGFVLPLTFGEQTDWFRNVRATGGCTIHWMGIKYSVVEPEIITWAAARVAVYPLERFFMPLIGIEQFVQFRHASESGNDSQASG